MRADKAILVQAFCRWLELSGWTTRTEVDFCDVVAERGPEKLYAQAECETTERGLATDTLYGQLLRRMPPTLDPLVRFGVVVRPSARGYALRVPDPIRSLLRIDVYVVDDDDGVEVLRTPL